MKFYLMRHGEAETYAASDQARQLTNRGSQQIRERILTLNESLSDIDCIVHSPFVRTTQTAEIVAEVLNIEKVISSNLWIPNADTQYSIESVEEFVETPTIFITHMPLIASVEAMCIGNNSYPLPFECGEISELKAEWPAAGLATCKRL